METNNYSYDNYSYSTIFLITRNCKNFILKPNGVIGIDCKIFGKKYQQIVVNYNLSGHSMTMTSLKKYKF